MTLAAPSDVDQRARAEVIAEIDRQFRRRAEAAAVHGPELLALWRLAASTVRGGKLIRPLLAVRAAHALDSERAGACSAVLTEVAAAIEMLHYAFVLHDDVIDGDFTRRHRPNLQGALREEHPLPGSPRAEHWARSAGILMGDLLLAAVHQLLARVDVDAGTRGRLLDLLEHTVTETVAGEHLDVGLADGAVPPDLHTTLVMTSRKTATYTFELPLRTAAVLTGADTGVEAELTLAGRHLGQAFQLQDDLLSAFGDGAEHGKDALSDFREGKQTALVAHARLTEQWPAIEQLLRAGQDDDQALPRELRAALEESGSADFVRTLVRDELDALHSMLCASSALPSTVQALLRDQARSLEGRRA